MDNSITTHITQNGKYRIVIERAASTKGTLGYKIEANNDDLSLLAVDIESLKAEAEKVAGLQISETKKGE